MNKLIAIICCLLLGVAPALAGDAAAGKDKSKTCAACHGTAGDGRGPRGLELSGTLWGWARGQGPGIFTDINLMAQRKPTELYQQIVDGRGQMPSYRGKLTDDEIAARRFICARSKGRVKRLSTRARQARRAATSAASTRLRTCSFCRMLVM
ncbi:MAG: cytochrome c [Betaproteobacteria bacterium]|nr:cytochrome c [Betaproteobacteria bacterium]